jgi:uncharacterized protein YuzE
MKVDYDREADALYVWLRPDEPYAYGEDIDSDRRIDYGRDGVPIGVEILNASFGVDVRNLPESGTLSDILREQRFKVYA